MAVVGGAAAINGDNPWISATLSATSPITNEVKGINRVTCDITSEPPGTIEWE